MSKTTETPAEASPPPAVWRALGLGAVLLLVGAVVAIGLISAGVFDPQPAGSQQQRIPLQPQTVAASEQRVRWQEAQPVDVPFTVRLTAALQEGETDVAYGLALGAPQRALTMAVSPTGYAAVWQSGGGAGEEMLLPWQPWPHVAQGRQPNEIQVDVQKGQITARVNREILWQGSVANIGSGVALHAESFGQAATVDFQDLVLFHE